MTKQLKIGLTGSIGMGKSTTAQLFTEAGCEIWDADAAVHRLYGANGAAVGPIGKLLPRAIVDGAVSRDVLKQAIFDEPDVLKQIEEFVHPLVAQDRADFRAQAQADVLVFDIPLLFETGGDKTMDAVACVSVSADVQRERVLARGTMTPEQFEQILAKQMPIAEKRERSDYVIETDTVDHARVQVARIMDDIKGKLTHA